MWTELETSTYQEHVIKHVLGATVLGWVILGDAVHFLLDIGLLWTVYVNAEMNLMAQAVAIQDLEGDDATRDDVSAMTSDADLLNSRGRKATGLSRFIASPVECLIKSVALFAADSECRILIVGETARLEIQTSSEPHHFSINVVGG